MPHPAHFLARLDRVPRSLTDFALALYRDPERVRWIIHYAHLPADEARVAFALGANGDGPYIVLTREGHFVTALGAEMTPKNVTILSRAQVDAFSKRVQDARARFELAKEIVPPGKEPEDVLNLLATRAWSITREQFSAIAAWVPLLGGRFLADLYEALEGIEQVRLNYLTRFDKAYRNDPDVTAGLFSVWSDTHAIGSRFILATMGDFSRLDAVAQTWDLLIGPTFPATSERILSITMRGAWAAARIGRAFLPAYRRILAAPGDMLPRFDAAIAVTAIGLRHAHYRDDARRALLLLHESPSPWGPDAAATIINVAHRALDNPEAALDDAAAEGADLLLTHADTLPDGSPYKFTRPDDVPRDLALLVAANGIRDSIGPLSFDLLPWVAQREHPEDLYFPADMDRALGIDWTADLIEQVYARQKGGKRPQVVRRGPRTGRNDPCVCGSGRKFKRCCGR